MNVDLEEVRKEFWNAWNGLSEVHTQEDLESQSEKMWAARKRLMKVDPEFRAVIRDRENKIKEEAERNKEQIQTKHKQIISEAEAEVAAAKMRAKAVMRMPDGELDEWVQKHKFKIVAPDEAKPKSKLICPICHDPDRHNLMNDKPACLKCMHVLVPEDELKNYNRDYRRRWKKLGKGG